MDETLPIILSTTVGFSYVTLLMVIFRPFMSLVDYCHEVTNVPLFKILALFHLSLGQQLNLFWVHKVLEYSLDVFLLLLSSSVAPPNLWLW